MSDQWYAVYAVDTHELISTGTVVADQATLDAKGYAAVQVSGQPSDTLTWNPLTLQMDVVSA